MVSSLDGAQDNGHKRTDVIIMDFAKAFDNVSHRRKLYKLDHNRIRGSTHKWISLWLTERSQKSGVGWSRLRSSSGLIYLSLVTESIIF